MKDIMPGATVYVAGPMSDLPSLNEPAFRKAAARLTAAGYTAIVPHDIPPFPHAGECPTSYNGLPSVNGHVNTCYLRACVRAMLTCEVVYLMDGWANSIGASLEREVAVTCGVPVLVAPLFDKILEKSSR